MAEYKNRVAEFLLLGDDGVVELTIATIIANRLDLDPVWLMLTGPSSSGKSELLNPFFELPYVIPISDLTSNTFASGYKMGGGREASLLMKYQNGIMLFKDFTSILAKGREVRDIILGQMREIFDGKFDKHTGTGEQITWRGKMGAIAAATASVYYTLAESSEMGQRFIYYEIKQPNRFDAAKRAHANAKRSTEMRAILTEEAKKLCTFYLDSVSGGDLAYDPPVELQDEMLRVADFASLARSPVHTDFKSGLVDMRVDKEMPGRIVKQLDSLAGAFIAMNQAEGGLKGTDRNKSITDHQRKILYRCAYDSIPQMRRDVLALLARYRGGVTTSGAAMTMGLPTDSVRKYLYQTNAIGLCDRKKEGGNQGDRWTMHDENYRKVVQLVSGVNPEDTELLGKDEDFADFEEDLDAYKEQAKAAEQDSLMPQTYDAETEEF